MVGTPTEIITFYLISQKDGLEAEWGGSYCKPSTEETRAGGITAGSRLTGSVQWVPANDVAKQNKQRVHLSKQTGTLVQQLWLVELKCWWICCCCYIGGVMCVCVLFCILCSKAWGGRRNNRIPCLTIDARPHGVRELQTSWLQRKKNRLYWKLIRNW